MESIIGNKYNMLTVVEYLGSNGKPKGHYYRCKCDCGNETIVERGNLISKHTKSCGCLSHVLKHDLVGKRFGRLYVKSLYKRDPRGKQYYLCECDCGNETIVRNDALIYGKTKSCGCLVKEINDNYGEANTTHGMSKTRFYGIWQHIKDRCLNPNNDNYDRYGGRGIFVCDRWKSDFSNFYDDMYESYVTASNIYGERNISIDRINNDDGYYKENCRWTTMQTQTRNRNCNTYYCIDGKEMCLIDIARDYAIPGVSYDMVVGRLMRGYDLRTALTIDPYYRGQDDKEQKVRRPVYFDITNKNIYKVSH